MLKIFKAHINVEWCKSVASIKYILKYITKGPDYASFKLVYEKTENDEISEKNENKTIFDEVSNYTTGRYINSNKAAWKIFGIETHKRFPPIQHLDVHLENNELWDTFWLSVGEDYIFKLNGTNLIQNDNEKQIIYELTYNEINKSIFTISGKSLSNFLINPPKNSSKIEVFSLLKEEKSYNLNSEKFFFSDHYKLLNEEQINIYMKISEQFNMKKPGILFIDAPGGTGKTFLLNVILSQVRSEGKIAIAVASSG